MNGQDPAFCWWDEEHTLLLISPQLFKLLPDGVKLLSISGQLKETGKDYIDQDTRGGMLAYGFQMLAESEKTK